ncbi:ABC transporter permease [Paenibacillus alkalitolerans]|uniref:ABC transporter permease n=1 Tax=Paenibacillus alkalitolerans TaxID=2799335 RepID=UPI0018F4F10A|nr:ABC transporter permease [Paenibacillus alkalitolerans]
MKEQNAADEGLLNRVYAEHRASRDRVRRAVLITQCAILIVFFGVWEAAGRLLWIDVLLFSYPSKITGLLLEKLADGSLLPHVGATVMETVTGFVFGTLIGAAAAAVLWWSPFLSKVFDPFIVVLNSMPKVALGPLFIVGLGATPLSIVAMTLAVTVIITTLVIYSSFKEVDANYTKVVLLFGGNRRDVFARVILPASVPAILSALKVNVGLSWIGTIVGEFLVSKQGLGYLIIYGFQVFNFSLVIGSLFIIAIVAAIMYTIVSRIESAFQYRS